MVFVPSRDLVHFQSRDQRDVSSNIALIIRGLDAIARALGTSDGEEEHFYISKDGSRTYRGGEGGEAEVEEGAMESREQRFELGYAKGWLEGVSCLKWLKLSTDGKEEQSENGQEVAIEEIQRRASRLIAICAGKAASGISRRAYHFECGVNGQETSVEVQDGAFVDDALGARTWGSAPLLVSFLLQEHLAKALVSRRQDKLRILELGSGTGLVGLAVAQYIKDYSRETAQVCLTDYHADVLSNLKKNVRLNKWIEGSNRVQVDVSYLDWNDAQSDEIRGRFNLIVAADCVYEEQHAKQIRTIAERYLALPRRAASKTSPQLFLCCPLRPTHQVELRRLEEVFASRTNRSSLSSSSSSSLTLRISHREDLTGWDDFGPPIMNLGGNIGQSGQETSFRLYIIQWC